MKFERLHALDCFKMIGILGITFAHTIVFEWSPSEDSEDERLYFPGGKEAPLFNRFLFYCLTLGGHFVVQSSTIRFYLLYSRIKEKRDKLKNMILDEVVYGFVLIFYHILFITVLSNTGLLYCLVRRKDFIWGKDILKEISTQTVIMLFGLSTIAIQGFHFILFTCFDIYRMKPIIVKSIFCTCGTIVLVLTPFIRTYLGKFNRQYLEEENWFKLYISSCVIGNNFPFFPFFGYTFFGCSFGYSFAIGESFSKMLTFYGLWTGPLFVGGLYGLYHLFGTNMVYSGLYEAYTRDGMFMKSFMHMSQVFLVIMSLLFIYRVLIFLEDRFPKRVLKKLLTFSQTIMRISMSVFLLEYLMKAVISFPFTIFVPDYNESLPYCLVFSLINSSCWIIVALLWRKMEWIGSFSWFYSKILKFCTGKVTTKMEKIEVFETLQVRVDRVHEKEL